VEVVDFSRRRGAIVHLLPTVYRLIGESGGHLPNSIIWNQEMRKALVDVRRKWLFVLEGTSNVRAILFYHLGTDNKSVYIDTMAAARTNDSAAALEALLVKFDRDDTVRKCEAFYVSREVRKEAAEEILETVGLQDESVYGDEGYQYLGGLTEAVAALKVRYLR